jgi:hypothetical protein
LSSHHLFIRVIESWTSDRTSIFQYLGCLRVIYSCPMVMVMCTSDKVLSYSTTYARVIEFSCVWMIKSFSILLCVRSVFSSIIGLEFVTRFRIELYAICLFFVYLKWGGTRISMSTWIWVGPEFITHIRSVWSQTLFLLFYVKKSRNTVCHCFIFM